MMNKLIQSLPSHGPGTASAKYWALVENLPGEDRSDQAFAEDFCLTAIEAAIFNIYPGRAWAMYWAFRRYESLVGNADNEFTPFRDQERAEFSAYFRLEGARFVEDAAYFMAASCLLCPVECLGWVLKTYASELRDGGISAL